MLIHKKTEFKSEVRQFFRLEISRIAKEAEVSPLRISFTMALRDIQDELMWCYRLTRFDSPKVACYERTSETLYLAQKTKTAQR